MFTDFNLRNHHTPEKYKCVPPRPLFPHPVIGTLYVNSNFTTTLSLSKSGRGLPKTIVNRVGLMTLRSRPVRVSDANPVS